MVKLSKIQLSRINNSLNLNPIGYILNDMINNRSKYPTLYTNNGSMQKSNLFNGIKHINLYKSK